MYVANEEAHEVGELPKSLSTKPKPATTYLTLYNSEVGDRKPIRHLSERRPPALVDRCGGGGDCGRKVVAVGGDVVVGGRGGVAARVDGRDLRRGVAPVNVPWRPQPPADNLL